MSRLAEAFDDGETRLSAHEIAESRKLQQPFVAKVLTTLSHAHLVVGSRGPGGGFSLARPPAEITLYDVFSLFEREDEGGTCPLGDDVCADDGKCPLHDRLAAVVLQLHTVLHDTTFDEFRRPGGQRTGGR